MQVMPTVWEMYTNQPFIKNFKRFKTLPRGSKRRIVLRYGLFQIPDLLILVLVLFVLQWWMDLPLWLYGCIGGLWVMKDGERGLRVGGRRFGEDRSP
jgi:hypothetical protein